MPVIKQTGAKRLYFFGEICVNAPLHIGQGPAETFGRHETDQSVLLDHEKQPFIPATALGGIMRSIAENLVSVLEGWGINDVVSLFGKARPEMGTTASREENEGEEEREVNGGISEIHISKVRLHHARLCGEWRGWTEVRDGVGIDRKRGATREGIKFDYEVVPPGTKFNLRAELRDASDKDKVLFALVLTALESLPFAIGAKGNIGLGIIWVKLDKVVEIDLTDKNVLYKLLLNKENYVEHLNGKRWSEWRDECLKGYFKLKEDAASYRVPQAVVFTYHLSTEEPILVKGRAEPTIAFDGYKKRKGYEELQREKQELDAMWIGIGKDIDMGDWKPFLPGSSLRGVFRSHCERILRTLKWHYVQGNRQEYEQNCPAVVDLWQMDKDRQARISEVWEKFMRTMSQSIEEERQFEAGSAVAKETWKSADLAERMFGSTFWKSRVTVTEAYLVEDGSFQEMLFDHLAVERFSGGAMEGKKFDTLPVTQATFEGKIVIWGDELWMLGLVALLFKDLEEGLIRFGSSKTRGFGRLKGRLRRVDAFLLKGSRIANSLGGERGKETVGIWEHFWWDFSSRQEGQNLFPACLEEADKMSLRNLLNCGIQKLNGLVKKYKKESDKL